ncbi:uncharacterized protein LOC111379692 isoform X2 [Olea europaea var. sylvestris]|uniref:uncharacterized protein LOC111379692 isoform X2 n=1 Tax=Olea europaea var. sylvestris TaxID=158386 RepID=UPI000C1D0BF6|nr:uncharacterized protein LOC111379692 isoform X2 [Olea europaea var. sylvestris]
MSLTRKTIRRRTQKHLRRKFGLLVRHKNCMKRAQAYLQNLQTMLKFLKLNAYLDELNDKTDVILAEMQEIKAEQEELNDEEEEVIAELETTENEIKELEKTFEDMLQKHMEEAIARDLMNLPEDRALTETQENGSS